MAYLLDTNILLRFAIPATSVDEQIIEAVRRLRRRGERLHFSPQNVAEAWNSGTRPLDKNGFGLSIQEADAMVVRLERAFTLLPDVPEAYPRWRHLVREVGVSGVQVHDARLVAWMQAHGITHILTRNVGDFARYTPLTGITVVAPEDVLA